MYMYGTVVHLQNFKVPLALCVCMCVCVPMCLCVCVCVCVCHIKLHMISSNDHNSERF